MPVGLRRGRGFTFVEISLVVVVLSVISLAIYSTFNAGTKIWQRASRYSGEVDISIFFDRFSRDIRNTFSFSLIAADGGVRDLSVACLEDGPAAQKKPGPNFGRVNYRFDPQKKSVYRQYLNFSSLLSGSAKYQAQPILSGNIASLSFDYYDSDGIWKDKFHLALLRAVKVTVVFESKDKLETFEKIIPIYAAGRFMG
jgi:prepilin-type N-terminal cleavage/methylation domain-containing protein